MSDKFTAEQIERCLARREYELASVKGRYGPAFVQNPDYNETNAMLRAYAALLRDGERVTVPDGWKLVPVEPTEAMIDKGIAEHRCEQGDPWYGSDPLSDTDCWHIYVAMISAAPDAMREQGGAK